jgi:hypothetical protein
MPIFWKFQSEKELQAPLECPACRPDGDRNHDALRSPNSRSAGVGAYSSEIGERRMYEVRGENGPHSGELNPTNGWGGTATASTQRPSPQLARVN